MSNLNLNLVGLSLTVESKELDTFSLTLSFLIVPSPKLINFPKIQPG